jgi:hypothetical protein
MKTTIDMSPDAVTNRMFALDELWELAVALKSSKIIDEEPIDAAIGNAIHLSPENDEG